MTKIKQDPVKKGGTLVKGGKDYFSTNHVLIHEEKPDEIMVYLPGYLRVKFKNFLELSLTNLTSLINVTLIFNFYYGDFFDFDSDFEKPSEFMTEIKQPNQKGELESKYIQLTNRNELIEMFMSQIKFNFSRDSALLLAKKIDDEQNLEIDAKHDKDSREIKFTVRKPLHVHLDGDLRWSPFELINSILEITVQPITFNLCGKNYTFRINLMSHPDNDLKLSYGEQRKFDHYKLAVKKSRASYTNLKIQKSDEFYMSELERHNHLNKKKSQIKKEPKGGKKQEKGKKLDVKYFQYAYFNIPMFRQPLTSFVTVFIPLWLLGLINLGIYFQDSELSDRIGSIIGIMLAFIAYIPTIEESIPPSSSIVFMEGLVYMQSFASLMTFIHSMRIRNIQDFSLVWYQTPQYWITLVVTAGSFIMVDLLMAIHYIYWTKSLYNDSQDEQLFGNQQIKRIKINKIPLQDKIINADFQVPNPPIKSDKKKPFDRNHWSNIACDAYFNKIFEYQKQQNDKNEEKKNQDTKDKGAKDSNEKQHQQKEPKKFKDYFIMIPRNPALQNLEEQFFKGENNREQEQQSAQEILLY